MNYLLYHKGYTFSINKIVVIYIHDPQVWHIQDKLEYKLTL